MKNSTLIILLSFISLSAFGQEDKTILEIRENFNKWQPKIEAKLKVADQLYHYAWGENYQNDEWYANELNTDDKFLFQKVSVIEDSNLGTFVYYDYYSMSGDWYIAIDYYFDIDGKLYFVFWRMNTFQADEDLTVEKRVYINTEGELIRNLKSVYKMNTKNKSTAGFADQDVEYELQLNKMDFYELWKSK